MTKASKNSLARLMATENLIVEHHNVKTAYFDVEKRLLGLPIWKDMSEDLYDLLIGHEVGHALFTPSVESLKEAINYIDAKNLDIAKGYLNVTEDARIEMLIKRRYPGLKRSFVFGYKDLMNRDFFQLIGKNVNEFSFIDRLNIHFKCGAAYLIKFTPEEQVFVAALEKAETFEEIKIIAKRIYDFCKNENRGSKTDNHMAQPRGSDDSGEAGESGDNESGESGESGDNESEGEGSGPSDESGDEESDDETSSKSGGQAGGAGGNDDTIVDGSVAPAPALTDEALEKMREKFVETTDRPIVYLNIPEGINLDKIVEDYKVVHERLRHCYAVKPPSKDFLAVAEKLHNEFRAANEKTVSFMVREFEMKKAADEYSRASVSRTGVLDTQKLHTYKYNDDLFRKVSTVTGGKNHGIVMFIDFSGSMHSNMAGTIDQLMTLVSFCRKTNIPFEVYSFTDVAEASYLYSSAYNQIIKNGKFDYKSGDLILCGYVRLCNYFSSRMNTVEYKQACINMTCLKLSFAFRELRERTKTAADYVAPPRLDGLNGTPLNDAIVIARHIVPKFQKETKVQIVNTIFLTDGSSNSNTTYFTGEKVEFYHAYSNHKTFLRDTLTKKLYETTNSREGLTSALLRSLRDVTASNVIGFFIASRSEAKRKISDHCPFAERDAKRGFFTKNHYVQIDSAGYNPYFVINSGNLEIDEEDFEDFEVKKNTTKSLAKMFSEFNRDKIGARVVAGKFIEKIAKQFS